MRGFNFPMAILGAFALAFGFTVAFALPLLAQETVVVQQPTTISEWLPIGLAAIMSAVGLFIGMAIKQAVAMLISYAPTLIKPALAAWFDQKRQNDLTKAITSAISKIILEGRWTSTDDALAEIKDHVWDSVGEAVDYFKLIRHGDQKTDRVLGNIAARQALDQITKIAPAAAEAASVVDYLKNQPIDSPDYMKDNLAQVLQTALSGKIGR